MPFHHDVVEDSTEYTSNDLGSVGTLWRQLSLLGKLQVAQKVLTLLDRVKGENIEVHVR